jgi:type II secretory ATPase GspE/PulE/Tfp pilus assembly ATPase PilB-like protein
MDAKRRNIVTVEDPVEYDLPGVGQIQVNPRIELASPRPCAPSCARTRT